MKINFLKLWGVEQLLDANRDLYSPDGEKLIPVSNGFLGGQLMYDYKNKKVYGLKFVDLTKNADKDFIEQCEFWARKKELTYKISKDNIDSVEKLILNK